jgi:2-polyprenyl-3-methyl-5-hydroxy-6-metoxy-1,4-benzoquinol methylase
MSNSLQERRMDAAIASKGTSSDVIYRLALKLLMERLPLNGDLLEYGAGTGSLITQLLQLGYSGKITGADILPKPDSLAGNATWIQGDLNEPLDLPGESFDVIISTEVIEHLENPRATFREFHRLLRPAGTIIVTTPNQESIRSLLGLMFGGHFVSFLKNSYPAHITALLRKDFERICLECGFSPPVFYFTNSGGIPKLPHIQWQRTSLGILKGRLFSDNLALMAKKF